MTNPTTAELREMLAKATPGPWKHYDEVFRRQFGRRRATEVQTRKGKAIINWSGFDGLPQSTARKRNANAALIVAAHNALPSLLDTIEGLERERDAMREALDDLQHAEAEYRVMHDLHGGDSRQAGRAWVLMRRAGDKARALTGKDRNNE